MAHCGEFEEDPLQSGKSEKQITEHMVYFFLHRYEFAGDVFGIISGYLSAIRWYFLEVELADPTKGNWLVRVMRGQESSWCSEPQAASNIRGTGVDLEKKRH